MLIHSGGNYFLVPGRWSRANGTTIVLPESPGIRIEFDAF
jgi:hypothetical protein